MQATATRPVRFTPRPRPRLRPRGPYLNLGDWFVVLIGLGCSVRINLVGALPYSEILTAIAFPFILRKHAKLLTRPGTRTILILMGIWLFSEMVSDVANASPMDNRLKGMARVIFFAIDFIVISALVGKSTKRIILLILALATSELIRLPTYGLSSYGTAWKYGGSAAISIFVMVAGCYFCARRRYSIFILSMAVLAFLNLHYGYRSQIAVDLVTLVFALPFSPRPPAAEAPAALISSKLPVLLICSLGAVWVSQKIINQAVKRGYFEESVQEKFEAQSSGQMGVLLGARPEIPVAIQAIRDAPVLGHGSYAVDAKYLILLQDYQYRFGYSESDEPLQLEVPGIPTHSHLTAAWVEGGVLASLLWFYLLWLIVRAMTIIPERRPLLAPLYAFLFTIFFWDILFSPFGYDRRIYEAFFIVMLVNLSASPAVAAVDRRVRPYVKRLYRMPNRTPFPRLPRPRPAR